ncbi:MAG: TlpA disulfide reductase family protein [Pirellulaceae bacterium]|nr:TlpA disulfide reductase family protein [Pirellulaceae bacterium]
MYPHERSLVKQLADKPFALIGVNSDRDREKLKTVMAEKDITWRSFWNGPLGTGGPISTKWNVRGWPTIYVLDANGKIRFKGVRGAAMDKAVTQLLGEAGVKVEITHEEEKSKGKP